MAKKPNTKISQEAQDNAQSYAAEIIKCHQRAITAQMDGCKEALGWAIKAGKALNLAYENIKAAKGKWADYLEEIKLPQTTSSMYRRLADNEDFIKSAAMQKAIDEDAADGALSIRGALACLPKRERTAPEKPKEKTLQPPPDDEDEEEVSEDTTEDEAPLPSVEEISGTVCNSGLSSDDLFAVATEIIKHVVNYNTPQDRLIAYQTAIADLWPVQQDIENEAEKLLENMKRAENSPNRLAA